MTTKRTRIARHQGVTITPEVVDAFRAGDYHRLHRALRLRPWQTSPLPLRVTELGVDYRPAPKYANADDWKHAQELRRQIEACIRAH